jgi:hypothetical protein
MRPDWSKFAANLRAREFSRTRQGIAETAMSD